MKPETQRAIERERAEAPKTGGKRPWALLVGLGLAAVLAGGVAYDLERTSPGSEAPPEMPSGR